MRRFAAIALLVLVGACAGAPLAAQDERAVQVYPRVGLLAPDAYLYEYFKNFTGDGLTEWTTGSLGRAFVAGVGAQVRLAGGDAWLRVEVARSFDGWLSASHSVETLRDLFFPPEVVTTWLDVPATLGFASLQVVLPTRFELGALEPYVLFGATAKHYAFGTPTLPNEVEATLPSDGFAFGGEVGAGLTVRLGGVRLDAQARDAITRYWGKAQHDFLFTGTVGIGLF